MTQPITRSFPSLVLNHPTKTCGLCKCNHHRYRSVLIRIPTFE
ncbi:unnamed protein product [Arabidopsis halleri]